jgi:hypothetical protein
MAAMSGRMRRWFGLGVWGLLVFGVAWYAGRRVAGVPPEVTRAYDVRDLLVEAPDFNNAPGLGISKAASPPLATRPTTEDRARRLAETVRASVAAGTWDQRPRGVTPLAGQLILTHTPEVHARVAALLHEWRCARQTMIVIQARFITLPDATVSGLPESLRTKLAPGPADSDRSAGVLDDSEVGALLTSGGSVVSAPRATVFNGQRAYVMVGSQTAYVARVTAKAAGDGKTSYMPEIETVNSGLLLDVQATAGEDGGSVTMSVRPERATLESIEPAGAVRLPDGNALQMQRPVVRLHTMRSTVTVPDRGTMLLAAWPEEAGGSTRPATAAGRMYLLVKPTVNRPHVKEGDFLFPREN